MLTDGMLSAAMTSLSVSVFVAPPMVMLRPASRSAGAPASTSRQQKETAKQERGKLQAPPQRLAQTRLSLSCVLDLARERADLTAYPFMAFVPVIARMPEEPQWKANAREGLVNALEPELPLEN